MFFIAAATMGTIAVVDFIFFRKYEKVSAPDVVAVPVRRHRFDDRY